jgi:hypothetical protein
MATTGARDRRLGCACLSCEDSCLALGPGGTIQALLTILVHKEFRDFLDNAIRDGCHHI